MKRISVIFYRILLSEKNKLIGYKSLHSSYFGEGNSYCNPIAIYPNYNIVVFILIYTNSGITLFSDKKTKKVSSLSVTFPQS